MQVFIYSNEEDVATISLFYFNKICNMFLSKVQQNFCYSQLCNYKEEFFLFKPISNQLNILVGCNLSFSRSLNAFYLELDKSSSVDLMPSKNLPPLFHLKDMCSPYVL